MIELINTKKNFDDQEVIKGLNLKIEDGKTTVILGRSGCGKSVLLKLILRLISLDGGKIMIDNIDTTNFGEDEMLPFRKKIGMLFQGSALFDSFNVEENVAYTLIEHANLKADLIRKKVREVLSFVDLDNTEKKLPSELSGGMKKRAALARAIINNPAYIFFDEPTTGLDPITSRMINELIVKTKKELGTTSVVVTHDLVSAFYVGDIFAFMDNGIIVFHGKPDEIIKADNPEIKTFLRESQWKKNSLHEEGVAVG